MLSLTSVQISHIPFSSSSLKLSMVRTLESSFSFSTSLPYFPPFSAFKRGTKRGEGDNLLSQAMGAAASLARPRPASEAVATPSNGGRSREEERKVHLGQIQVFGGGFQPKI